MKPIRSNFPRCKMRRGGPPTVMGDLFLLLALYLFTMLVCSPRTLASSPLEQPQLPLQGLNLWIDGKEIEQFVGVPMDIFVIRDSMVVPYLQDAYFDQQLPVLPPEVHIVTLTWQATDDVYKYSFSDLRSLDPSTLYDPLLSIPQDGIIPKHPSDFQMAIPCTGQVTGIASMYIVLHVVNSRGYPVPGSPLQLHLRKRCIAFAESRAMCRFECENEGKCNSQGQCECKPGFYGTQCQLAVCFPTCVNNGSCIAPGKCLCMQGFIGDRCEIPICRKACHNGGTCIAPEMCECPQGYYGNYCQFKSGSCKIPCKNGGVCTAQDRCACPTGYMGQFCQRPICKRSCGVNGYCVAPNQCDCYRGWRGKSCHKTKNRHKDNHNKRLRRKRRKLSRLLRHGRATKSRRKRKDRIRNNEERKKRHRNSEIEDTET